MMSLGDRRHTAGLLLLAAMLVAPAPAAAQSLEYAGVSGVVRDAAGAAVARALVTLRDPAGELIARVDTDQSGQFRLGYVEPGRYEVLVERLGYRPLRVTRLRLERGTEIRLPLTLSADRSPAGPADEVVAPRMPAAGALTAASAGDPALRLFPLRARQVGELAERYTPAAIEGLPLSMLQVRVGGGAVSRGPGHEAGGHPGLLPIAAVGSVRLEAVPDVEWDATGGVALGLSLRGPEHRGSRLDAAGSDQGQALGGNGTGDASDLLGAITHSANPRDGFTVFGGGSWHRVLRNATPSAAVANAAAASAAVARQTYGLDVDPAPRTLDDEAATIFGRADYRWGHQSLRLHALYGHAVSTAAPDAWVTPRSELDRASAGALRLEWSGWWSERLAGETRIGLSREARRRALPPVPHTLASNAPVYLGGADPAEMTTTTWSAAQVFHRSVGRHQLKAGASLDVNSIGRDIRPVVGPRFVFGGSDAHASASGIAILLPGSAARAEFSTRRLALFAQDVVRIRPDLRLLVGTRVVFDQLPRDRITLDDRWFLVTGLANTALFTRTVDLEPRLAVDWTPGGGAEWRVFGAAGLHHAPLDPAAMAELIGNDAVHSVRRLVGDLGAWPDPVGATAAPARTALTVPGPTFRGARTLRAHGGVTRHLGARASAGLDLVVRATDRLLVRTDANLRTNPWGQDSHGRTVWAPLVKVEGVVAAAPDQRARDGAYDHVWMLDASASSRYVGLSGRAELEGANGWVLHARYTLSRTDDDWMLPRGGGWDHRSTIGVGMAPADAGWLDGRSDLDMPHHLIVDAASPVPVPLRPVVAVRYQARSDLPFTPGYAPGVDVNGDGLWTDPAFIDETVAGIGPLVSEWSCLGRDAGAIARRNGCRRGLVHSLDVGLRLDLVRGQRSRVTLTLDALDVVHSPIGVVDAALYEVPADEPLAVSPTGAVVAIPVRANPGFGSLLVDLSPATTLQVGMRVAF